MTALHRGVALLHREQELFEDAAEHEIAEGRDEAGHGAAAAAERGDRALEVAALEEGVEEDRRLARHQIFEARGAGLEIGERERPRGRRAQRQRLVDEAEDAALGGVALRRTGRRSLAEEAARCGLAHRGGRGQRAVVDVTREDVEHLGEHVDVAIGGGRGGVEEAADHRDREVLLLAQAADGAQPLEVLFAVIGDGAPALRGLGSRPSRR